MAGEVGVRVRSGSCRPIIFERGRWTEYGVSYSIPVQLPRHPKRTGISSLASNVRLVEESGTTGGNPEELRKLVAGEISFDDVIGQPGRTPGEFSRETRLLQQLQSA